MIVAGLATLITRYAGDLWLFLRSALTPRLEMAEWDPIVATSPEGVAYVILLTPTVLGWMYHRRVKRPVLLFLYLVAVLLPLIARRHAPLFALALVILAGEHMADAASRLFLRRAGGANKEAVQGGGDGEREIHGNSETVGEQFADFASGRVTCAVPEARPMTPCEAAGMADREADGEAASTQLVPPAWMSVTFLVMAIACLCAHGAVSAAGDRRSRIVPRRGCADDRREWRPHQHGDRVRVGRIRVVAPRAGRQGVDGRPARNGLFGRGV